MSSGPSSCLIDPMVNEINNNDTVSELDDYFYALFVQVLLISDDRETGALGKLSPDSDPQIAIEHMLQEAQEMEQSYRLAKSLSTCEAVPDNLLEEMSLQDDITRSDRELSERVERGESSAESSLHAATARFESFIPVRCCKVPFASALVEACLMDAGDVSKYESLRCEIENPCPPASELDVAASRVISENGWKVCNRCGAVVERLSGCVHMTCVCRNEFCYTCRKTWRTCNCELYPVEELNQILDERIGNDDPGTARHRLQNVLRNYYQHEHNWERRKPFGRVCGVCGWAMPVYCLHCEGCLETRCHRCTFNN
ncbi:hypothetical protein K457DRAFT_129497 [Linnemannia elongata AG-77]|uniref:RING-type domain-containing protein n=1 Tax=Linnemannia elongata AG-77 TaxID=1314771 RepID=A0A197JHX1_9FUNG|nr:hypothetical protein K457DRAFT_129497 [Linnemannia elongata AG-77]